MVDSVSGNAGTGLTRQQIQLANGRTEGATPRIDQSRSADLRAEGLRSPGTLPPGERPSGQVSEALNAIRAMAAQPPVDAARVADLRASIEGGSYSIDPDRIADAMLRSETGVSSR